MEVISQNALPLIVVAPSGGNSGHRLEHFSPGVTYIPSLVNVGVRVRQ